MSFVFGFRSYGARRGHLCFYLHLSAMGVRSGIGTYVLLIALAIREITSFSVTQVSRYSLRTVPLVCQPSVRRIPVTLKATTSHSDGVWNSFRDHGDDKSLHATLANQRVLRVTDGTEISISEVISGQNALVVFMRHIG